MSHWIENSRTMRAPVDIAATRGRCHRGERIHGEVVFVDGHPTDRPGAIGSSITRTLHLGTWRATWMSQKGHGCFNCASALEVIYLNHSDRSLMTSWKLKRTAQCAHCPWRVEVDPHDIPHGYCESKHQALAATIAEPGALPVAGVALHVMVCHETDEAHCIGWLNHQLGPGNNLALRLRMMSCENRDKLRLRGEQHPSFETTLPRASVDPA